MLDYSAGILVYIEHNGEKLFLLGKDAKYQSWSDFGGKVDVEDRSDPLETAAREFYEETSGVLLSKSNMYSMLKKHGSKIECTSYRKKRYYMYILRMEIDESCIEKFKNQNRFLKAVPDPMLRKFIEKDELQFFSMNDIIGSPKQFRSVFYNSIMKHIDVIRSA